MGWFVFSFLFAKPYDDLVGIDISHLPLISSAV